MLTNDSILNVIKKKMKILNLSQSDLARKINQKPSFINRVLKGSRCLNIDQINTIATALETETTTLMLEATLYNPEMTSLATYLEEIILESELSFELWSILSVELSRKEISDWFGNIPKNEIDSLIQNFINNNLIFKSKGGLYKKIAPPEKFIHFTYTDKYRKRRNDFTAKVLNSKPNFKLHPPVVRSEWLNKQSDVFMVDYFTEEQIIERKKVLRDIWNFVLTQRQINTRSEKKPSNLKLHMFSLTDMEVPTTVGQNE